MMIPRIDCLVITRRPVQCRPGMVAVPGTQHHAEADRETLARRVPEDLSGMEEALPDSR
jgi:hypothetical protein